MTLADRIGERIKFLEALAADSRAHAIKAPAIGRICHHRAEAYEWAAEMLRKDLEGGGRGE